MTSHSRFQGIRLILVISGWTLNRLNSVVGQYAQACVQAAAQCGTDVLDLWSLMQKDCQVSWHINVKEGMLIPANIQLINQVLLVLLFEHHTMICICCLQDYTIYLSDGLHLSQTGNQFVAQHLWKLLESRVAHLPFILPYWGDVDPKSPESSLLSDQ